MTSVSIGICAFNEESNITKILDSILNQNLDRVEIIEIIVISSASTDSTDRLVMEYSDKDSRVRLITEETRKGKASAVNLFLKLAKGEICVIQSADTISTPNTIEEICKPIIDDDKIGAVGGRPIPIKGPNFLINSFSSMIWELHSRVSRKQPKLGEISAHRNVIEQIPSHAIADDAYLEFLIRDMGLETSYSHEAVIYNSGPDSLSEYIQQRVRWRASQIRLNHETGHISASGKQNLVNLELALLCLKKPWKIPIALPLCLIELHCIRAAKKSLASNEDEFIIWDSIDSTKKVND